MPLPIFSSRETTHESELEIDRIGIGRASIVDLLSNPNIRNTVDPGYRNALLEYRDRIFRNLQYSTPSIPPISDQTTQLKKSKKMTITIETQQPIKDIIKQTLSLIFKNKYKINVSTLPSYTHTHEKLVCDLQKIEPYEKNWKKYHKKLKLNSKWLSQQFYYNASNYVIKGISQNKQDVICLNKSNLKLQSFSSSDIIYIMQTNIEGED
jgi:hypothetical protein